MRETRRKGEWSGLSVPGDGIEFGPVPPKQGGDGDGDLRKGPLGDPSVLLLFVPRSLSDVPAEPHLSSDDCASFHLPLPRDTVLTAMGGREVKIGREEKKGLTAGKQMGGQGHFF